MRMGRRGQKRWAIYSVVLYKRNFPACGPGDAQSQDSSTCNESLDAIDIVLSLISTKNPRGPRSPINYLDEKVRCDGSICRYFQEI